MTGLQFGLQFQSVPPHVDQYNGAGQPWFGTRRNDDKQPGDNLVMRRSRVRVRLPQAAPGRTRELFGRPKPIPATLKPSETSEAPPVQLLACHVPAAGRSLRTWRPSQGTTGDEQARREQREVNAEEERAQEEEKQGLFGQAHVVEIAPNVVPHDDAVSTRQRVRQAIHVSRETTKTSKRLREEARVSVGRAQEIRLTFVECRCSVGLRAWRVCRRSDLIAGQAQCRAFVGGRLTYGRGVGR